MSQKNSVDIFMPIRKVDEERRLVFGLVTEEIVDQSGEILDYETSKPHFEKWSGDFQKNTDGASAGNLRLMHQPVVAGKLVSMTCDDDARQISCVAKVVDEASWQLVLEGCLTGFSMGGRYMKKWKDDADKSVTRFTAKPVEVSLVDNPCVSTATFEVQKADGSVEIRKFHSVGDDTMITNDMVLARAQELAKAAGNEAPTDDQIASARVLLEGEAEAQKTAGEDPIVEEHSDPAETPEAEPVPDDQQDTEARRADAAKTLVQVWQAPDGRTFAKKDEGVTALLAGPTPTAPTETAVEKALREARGEPAPEAPVDLDFSKTIADLDVVLAGIPGIDTVSKGLYSVSYLADVLGSLRSLLSMVTNYGEGNTDSAIPSQIAQALRDLGSTLVDLAQEEVQVLLNAPGMPAVIDIVELSALADMTKANAAVVEKAGARNSKSDKQKLQAMHDNSVALGADCGASKTVTIDNVDDLPEDVVENLPVVKALRQDIGNQTSEIEKAVAGIAELGKTVAALTEELTVFKNAPRALPPRSDHVIVERGGQSQTLGMADIEKMTPDEKADLMIRISQTSAFTPNGVVRS